MKDFVHLTEKRQKQLMNANTNETKEEDKEDSRNHGHPEFLLKRKLEVNFLANSALIQGSFFFFVVLFICPIEHAGLSQFSNW